MFLGKLKRNEEIPITLTLDASPTGTPQYRILDSARTEIVVASNLSGSGLNWYKTAQNVGTAAAVGSYLVEYTAVIDGVTRYAYDTYEVTINEIDDVKSETALILTEANKIQTVDDNVDQALLDIAAVPTVAEIDIQLTSSHGSGSWLNSSGAGAYNAEINVKDDSLNNVTNAKITIHNSSDDDTPVIATGITDTLGNVTLNIDGSVYVRVSKVGFNFTSTNINVTASGTYNVSGTVITYLQPADPDLCRLFVYPITLDNQDVTDIKINISSKDGLTKVNGEFIKNASLEFTYDNTTTPDSYYFDAVQGTTVHINCDLLGIDHEVTVPVESTKDLNDLVT
jgi:hypothetical protein